MVSDEILGGLRSAMERGYSLEKAMITLYNSGYKRKDIEESAIAFLEANRASQIQEASKDKSKGKKSKFPQRIDIPPTPPIAPVMTAPAMKSPVKEVYIPGQKTISPPAVVQRPISSIQQIQQRAIQRVSEYGTSPAKEVSKGKGSIILLIVLLLILGGAFAAIFVFKDQFIDFLNSLFG